MEAAMDTAPTEVAPKLKGLNPNEPAYKQHLCPHGKPGNGWFCGDPGCSGQGLCDHKKQKQACKECKPAKCPLCNNGRIYAWGSMMAHIYNTKLHSGVPEADKQAAYWDAGIQEGHIRVLRLGIE